MVQGYCLQLKLSCVSGMGNDWSAISRALMLLAWFRERQLHHGKEKDSQR
jgi:hypothetical protein